MIVVYHWKGLRPDDPEGYEPEPEEEGTARTAGIVAIITILVIFALIAFS
jgi:hypothetical protein